MKPDRMLELVEETVRKAGIDVRYEKLDIAGCRTKDGICRIGGKTVLFVHKGHPVRTKVRILVDVLKGIDVSGLYIKPAVRNILDSSES